MDDLSLLQRLPDNVKRSILLSLSGLAHPDTQQSGDSSQTTKTDAIIHAEQPDSAQSRPGPQRESSTGQPNPRTETPAPQQLLLPRLNAGLAVLNNVITQDAIQAARVCAEAALAEKHRQAGMGGSLLPWKDNQARGDVSRWLHLDEEQAAGRTGLEQVLTLLTQLQAQLHDMGYDVGGRATYQLACYPGGGSRYVRHADRSDSAPTRRLTAILYLNPDWTAEAGGQLAVYNCTGNCDAVGWEAGEPATLVAPLGGRLVVFESHIDHEVLPAHQPRWAVTAWFHCSKTTTLLPPAPASLDQPTPRSHLQPSTSPTQEQGASSSSDSADAASNTTREMRAATSQQAALPATSALPDQPSIFVSIAAYRDPECQWTIRDLFKKARRPHRVHVGVVWQVEHKEDAELMQLTGSAAQWAHQVREVRVPASEATGPCKARALAACLWSGEKYLLQIDSHMRFVEGWDDICIQQLQRAEALLAASSSNPASSPARAVLTTYPAGYEGEGIAVSYSPSLPPVVLCLGGIDKQGMMRTKGRLLVHDWEQRLSQAAQTTRAAQNPALAGAQGQQELAQLLVSRRQAGDPLPCVGWAAGFSFSRADALLRDAPYPPPSALPHLFFGEEMYMYARLWTRGYEFFSPALPVCFHQWQRSARKHTINKAATSDAEQQLRDSQRALSQAKVLAVLGCSGSGWPEGPIPAEWQPGGRWGLGMSRTSEELQAWCGVSLAEQSVVDEAACCAWLPPDLFEA